MSMDSIPVAQLMTILGLDSNPFMAAIGDVKVNLRDIQGELAKFAASTEGAFTGSIPAVTVYQQLMEKATRTMGSQAEAAIYLTTSIEDYAQSQVKAAEATRLALESEEALAAMQEKRAVEAKAEAASRVEAEALYAQLRAEEYKAAEAQTMAEADMASKRQAIRDAEKASQAEYAELTKFYQQEELSSYYETLDEYEAINEEMTASDMERLAALKVKSDTEKALIDSEMQAYHAKLTEYESLNEEMTRADVERMAARETQQASNVYGSAGVRVGAGGIEPMLRIGMMGLGKAIEPLFPILMAGAFVDILYHEVEAVAKLTDEWTGMGVAAKAAWEKAFEGAEKSRNQTSAILKEDRLDRAELAKGSPLSKDERIKLLKEHITKDIDVLNKGAVEQIGVMRAHAQELEKKQAKGQFGLGGNDPNDYGGAKALFNRYMSWAKGEKSLEEINKEIEKTEDSIKDFANDRRQTEKEIARISAEREKGVKQGRKWHDEVHEFPGRVPWFMGGGLNGYTGSFGASSIVGAQGHLPPPMPNLMRSGGGSGSPAAPTSRVMSTGGSGGGSGSVVVHNTYAPVFKFDGVPADIQKFMRDVAEPKLIEDMDKNSRGITDKIVQSLRKRGVAVQ